MTTEDLAHWMALHGDAVVRFADAHALFAVAMSVERARSGLAERLARGGNGVLVHTVNQPEIAREMRTCEVAGIYTDFLCGGDP